MEERCERAIWTWSLDGLCQTNGELVTWYKSHGLETLLFRLPRGVFMDRSPFMTLLQVSDSDVWLAKVEQVVCRELWARLFTPQ